MSDVSVLRFSVDGRDFALPVRTVREITRSRAVTPVPYADPAVRGLLNLRGEVITVFDLGVRLGLGRRPWTAETRSVVLRDLPAALLVDGVDELETLPGEAVAPLPAAEVPFDPALAAGKATVAGGPLILLEATALLPETAEGRTAAP